MATQFISPDAKRLILSCRKCTRQGVFFADGLDKAVEKAIAGGWVLDAWPPDREQYVCPRCPSSNRRGPQPPKAA